MQQRRLAGIARGAFIPPPWGEYETTTATMPYRVSRLCVFYGFLCDEAKRVVRFKGELEVGLCVMESVLSKMCVADIKRPHNGII